MFIWKHIRTHESSNPFAKIETVEQSKWRSLKSQRFNRKSVRFTGNCWRCWLDLIRFSVICLLTFFPFAHINFPSKKKRIRKLTKNRQAFQCICILTMPMSSWNEKKKTNLLRKYLFNIVCEAIRICQKIYHLDFNNFHFFPAFSVSGCGFFSTPKIRQSFKSNFMNQVKTERIKSAKSNGTFKCTERKQSTWIGKML